MPGASMQISQLSGPYAGQVYDFGKAGTVLPKDFWSPTPPASGTIGAGGGLPAAITPPDIKPFNYSTESQSGPTYMRNLGENMAQRSFQQATNRIGMGNSAQNFMHAQDRLNNERLGYMGQAAQQELAIQNAMAAQMSEYQRLLAQLYGTQVAQRGQDVGYAGDLARANATVANSGGGVLRMGGGSSSQQSTGTYTPMGGNVPSYARAKYDAPSQRFQGGW